MKQTKTYPLHLGDMSFPVMKHKSAILNVVRYFNDEFLIKN